MLALSLLSGAAAAQSEAAQEPSQSRAKYVIEARYDEDTRQLGGNVTVTWTNQSGEPVRDLWFHLYLNAFANNRSTHLKEAGGRLRGRMAEEGWGWSRVDRVQIGWPGGEGGEEVNSSFRYRQPDDANEEDRTVFSVDLPRPVASGETVLARIDWVSQLPRVRRRTGYKDDFLLVAQWFPKLAVYEAGRGWNAHQFHANTEFYSNYGTYDVRLDLPANYKGRVGGSGRAVREQLELGRLKVRFEAPTPRDRRREDATGKRPLVHDFTWTADEDYVVMTQIFKPQEWMEDFPDEVERARAALGDDFSLEMRPVDVTVLSQPERASQADRHFKATCAALFFYGLWFGEYPYEHVTVVDPAWGARAAGGMEYPTLFTCGSRLFTTEDMQQPEGVTVHECGHQFWYGLVGNNEFEAAWMDEGFNSFTDSEVLWRVYGPRRETTDYLRVPVDGRAVADLPHEGALARALTAQAIPVPLPFLPDIELHPVRAHTFKDSWRDKPRERSLGFLALYRDQPCLSFVQEWTDPRWADRARYLGDPNSDPIETWGWEYVDRESYVINSYPRTAVALRTLAAVVGDQAFLRGMRHYSEDWRYAHPYPEDFYRSFQQGSGTEVDWYFREVFQGTGTVDWQVEVDQERRPDPVGFFQAEGGQFLERAVEEGAEEEERPWKVEVLLRKEGELALPMPLTMTFEDGTTRDLLWSREEQQHKNWRRVEFESDQKLVSVVLDPERGTYIDSDMSNNQWFDATDAVAPWRWGERTLAQFQRYFHWISGLGG